MYIVVHWEGKFYNLIWIYSETPNIDILKTASCFIEAVPIPEVVLKPHINHMNWKLLVAHMSAHAAAEESNYHKFLPYWMPWWASNLHNHHKYFLNSVLSGFTQWSNKIAVFIHKYCLHQKKTQSTGGLTKLAMVCSSDRVQLFTLDLVWSSLQKWKNHSVTYETCVQCQAWALHNAHSTPTGTQQLTLPSLSTLQFRAKSNYCYMQEHDKVRWIIIEDFELVSKAQHIYPYKY